MQIVLSWLYSQPVEVKERSCSTFLGRAHLMKEWDESISAKFIEFDTQSSVVGRTHVAAYVFSGTPGVGKTHMGHEMLRRFHDPGSGVLPTARVPMHARMSISVDFNGRCDFSHRGVFSSMPAYVRYLLVCGFLQILPAYGIAQWRKAGILPLISRLLETVSPSSFLSALSRALLCRGQQQDGQDWSAMFIHVDEIQKLPSEEQREFTQGLLQHSVTNTDEAIARDARIFPVFVFTGTFIKILLDDDTKTSKKLEGSSYYKPGWTVLRPLELCDAVKIDLPAPLTVSISVAVTVAVSVFVSVSV